MAIQFRRSAFGPEADINGRINERVVCAPMSAVEVDFDVARKQTSPVTALYVASRRASEHISATRSKVVGC
ncbi:hypothetical protein AC244_29100 [Ensifer adhaerens]|uniref:Uncharacterized protein n=1 Tax=Ensifer adhaerens TaxID=106592 RepID=A0A0L8BHB2_ENSAD|nr:hypothetical protein AC244_29100 [Ensifer adhaerens]